MADEPTPSTWTQASPSLEELRYMLHLAYDHLRRTGQEMTATELRVALRRPIEPKDREP